MGSNTSKTSPETAAPEQKNDSDKDNPDPRSPTPEITRTPLQNKNGGKHNITKNVDLRKTFECGKTEEKLIHNNPILSAVIKNHLQSYDPRSPTQDFARTPIIIASKIDNNPGINLQKENHGSPCLQNETIDTEYETSFDTNEVSPDLVVPKNLCNGFYDLTLNESIKDIEEPLGSSTTSNENIENNISKDYKHATELLETNFEYVETKPANFENNEECIENTDIAKNADVDIKNIPLFKILNDDPRSPSIGIDRTPIVVSKIEENINEENVENMSDDSLIKALQNNGQESPEGIPIYEDDSEALNETPKKTKASSDSGSRTPLSCMKNRTETSHARSKSTNIIYDPKKESKLPKRVSHIPRLKSLSKQPKFVPNSSISLKNIPKNAISGDCENTPPHSHRDLWDKESSIVL